MDHSAPDCSGPNLYRRRNSGSEAGRPLLPPLEQLFIHGRGVRGLFWLSHDRRQRASCVAVSTSLPSSKETFAGVHVQNCAFKSKEDKYTPGVKSFQPVGCTLAERG